MNAKRDLVTELTDLRHLNWLDQTRYSSGTPGCFLKTRDGEGTKMTYYKLSMYDSYRGIYGKESIYELIASRVMDVLGIDHAPIKLIRALIVVEDTEYETWLSSSRNFRKGSEQKMALDAYYDLYRQGKEKPIDFCERQGWLPTIFQMMVADFIIGNRDRHGANIEVLFTCKQNQRLAPLFDHGSSLLMLCETDEEAAQIDVMRDFPVNNYLGTRSLFENLNFITQQPVLSPITDDDRRYILRGLDRVLSSVFLDKIWEMIIRRWRYYENLFYRA